MRNWDLISAWEEYPNYCIDVESLNQRIQVKFFDEIIVDSENVLLLKEQELNPKYYFPQEDINEKYFTLIDKATFCPFKGLATHWALDNGVRRIDCAAWSYDNPFKKLSLIQNHIAFYPNDDVEFIVNLTKSNNFQEFTGFYSQTNNIHVLH